MAQSTASSSCSCGNRSGNFLQYKHLHYILGWYCMNCGQEWLTKTDLRNLFDKKKFIVCGNSTFYLNERKQSKDKKSEDKIRPRREEIVDQSRLRAGDHIQWDENNVSNHAIIEDTTSCVRFRNSGFCQIEIVRCPLEDIATGRTGLIRYEYDKKVVDRPELTIARARSWVGQGSVNLFTENHKSFAMYCKVGALLSWTTIWFLGSFMSSVHSVSGETFWRTGKQVQFRKFFENLRLDVAEGHDITVGFVITADASAVTFDLQQMYTNRQNRHESREDFLKGEMGRIIESINGHGFTIDSLTTETQQVSTMASLKHGSSDKSVGFIIGSIISGDPVGIPERICGTTLGRQFATLITMTVKYDDRLVEIGDIRQGDQIVMCAWFFHPRCHAIVLHVDEERRILRVIRNTHENGVIEESLEFVRPVYRVTYAEGDRRPVEDIIRRAKSKLGTKKYNLLTYNCKHFATWCSEW